MTSATHAGLHFIEHQQQTMLIAQGAQALQELIWHDAHPALAHDRLDQDGGGCRADRALRRLEIAERNLIEAFCNRAEAVQILLVAASSQCGERSSVERTLECDDAIALGVAGSGVVLARDLDAALHRFGTGIAKEHELR